MSTLDSNCIFCKIIRGEIPCQALLDGDSVLAFLDINPLSEGHTVVIPKTHAARLEDLDPDAVAAMAREFGRLGAVVSDAVGADGYNVLLNNGQIAGQAIGHVHFHIIPRREEDGLGYRWRSKEADHAALKTLADKVRLSL